MKHKLIPIECSKNETDRFVDLLIYKNQHVLNQILDVFSGKQDYRYICRRWLYSYTNQDVLINEIQKCSQQEIISKKTSKESQLYWKDRFHKNSFYFRNFADFEADNEIDISKTGNQTTNLYKQILILIGYYKVSELDDILKSG